MKFYSIIEKVRGYTMIGNIKTAIFVVGCMALIALGCAHSDLRQSPAATYRASQSSAAALAGNFQAVVVEDLDNDGHLDIVGGASNPGMITINYGDGKGGISETQLLPVKGAVSSVAVADFNEDGLNDIVFPVQKSSSGIRIWMNQSKRKWVDAKGPIGINNYQSVKTGDVNGDGHVDIIAANITSEKQGGVQAWLGDGKGKWFKECGPTVHGRYMDVVVADFNGDGTLDLVGAGWGTHGALRLWLGDGAGNWAAAFIISHGHFNGITLGDVNNDGILDLLAGSYRLGPKIFQGDGRGRFTQIIGPAEYLRRQVKAHPNHSDEEVIELTEESFWAVLPVDLDGDGRVDILASSMNQHGILAWRNKGKDKWEIFKGQFPSSGTYYEMVLADINNDGSPDICAASSGEGIKIWPGKAGVTFTAKNMAIEQLGNANRLAALEAPLENKVFATIDGIPEYKIGPGDVLELTLWKGNEPTKEEILIRQNGKISFGFVEDLQVNGLTTSQLDALLTRRIGEYVRKPRIDVVVKKHNSKFVTLLGAITSLGVSGKGPGKYTLTGRTTLLEAITKAGGPAPNANLENISVRRRDGRAVSLNLFKAIQQGDPEQDFILDDGDVVFVPLFDKSQNRVYVFGEVKNPGAYEYIGAKMKLFDAVSEAGGATIFASTSNTKVVRGDPTAPEIISANLKNLVEEGDQTQNVVLAGGDLVYVPRSGFGEVNLFAKRIRPILELILWPARIVKDWDDAADIISGDDD
ncbi:MAG: FG-GAP-like repeat-containing protein [Desulfobacterales bacterium]|jgi:protein involved in polysaccharide export with SLBB domain/outer membrane lipoprotein SlyB